jgi:hypothetical protein
MTAATKAINAAITVAQGCDRPVSCGVGLSTKPFGGTTTTVWVGGAVTTTVGGCGIADPGIGGGTGVGVVEA